MTCQACGTELRITSMTEAGVSYACDCGRTTLTQLSSGGLDVTERAALDECTERKGCAASMHLTTCPEHR